MSETDKAPGNWITYNGTYEGDGYSTLNEINTSNVKQLRLLHTFDLVCAKGKQQKKDMILKWQSCWLPAFQGQ